MNNRIMQVAFRIALIKEEFPEDEILQAVNLLEEQGSTSALLTHLAGRKREVKKPKISSRRRKPLGEQKSKAVAGLEHTDPEKFQILSEFDSLLRRSRVLPELDEIKRLGERLSKSFAPQKSRRESISKLMFLLADRPLNEIREIVQATLSNTNVDKSDNDYQQLAHFIITGKTSQTDGEQRTRARY